MAGTSEVRGFCKNEAGSYLSWCPPAVPTPVPQLCMALCSSSTFHCVAPDPSTPNKPQHIGISIMQWRCQHVQSTPPRCRDGISVESELETWSFHEPRYQRVARHFAIYSLSWPGARLLSGHWTLGPSTWVRKTFVPSSFKYNQ